jgi:N-acetylglutamate synthase-like GNAT family acetyltransferase
VNILLEMQEMEKHFGGKGCFLVAEHEGRLVGCIGLKDRGNGNGEIVRFTVIPEMHRRGIGGQLLSTLEERMRQEGFSRMFLHTFSALQSACGFYNKTMTLERESACTGDMMDSYGCERVYSKTLN